MCRLVEGGGQKKKKRVCYFRECPELHVEHLAISWESTKLKIGFSCSPYSVSSCYLIKKIKSSWKPSQTGDCYLPQLFFLVVIKLSISICTLPMLTLLSVDEILLPRYMNWSTDFRSLLCNEEMAPPSLNHMNSTLSKLSLRPMPLTVCSRLCSWDSSKL